MTRLAALVVVGLAWIPSATAGEPLSAEDRAFVDGLARDLDAPDPAQRLRAVRALEAVGPPAASAVPKLVPLIDADADDLSRAALRAVLAVGPEQPAFGPALVARLRDPDPSKRVAAMRTFGSLFDAEEDGREGHSKAGGHADGVVARALARLGPDGRKVMPAVVENLGSDDPDVRREAIMFVEDAGTAASEAVPKLVLIFDDPDVEVRSRVAGALLNAGRDSTAVVPAFVRVMEGRGGSSYGLEERFDPSHDRVRATRPERDAPALIEALGGKSAVTRKTAALCLWHLRGRVEVPLRALERLWDDPGADVSYVGAALLLARNPDDGPARAFLVRNLTRIRKLSVWPDVLPLLGNAAAAEVPRLIADGLGYGGASGGPMLQAARVLKALGPVAVPGLVEAARRGNLDPHTRGEVVRVLGSIAARDPGALDAVVAMLDDPDLARPALWALAEAGPAAKGALPKLAPFLKSVDPGVRASAARVAWKVGGDPAPLLAEAEKVAEVGGSPETEALVEIGKPALPLLVRGFRVSPDLDVAEAIAAIEKSWSGVAGEMAAVMAGDDPDARLAVARVFADFRPDAPPPGKPCVDVLVRALADPDPLVSRLAATSLARVDPGNAGLLAFLTLAWSERHDRDAARVLADCGPAAKGAVPVLKASLADPDRAVRDAAAHALYAIDRDAVPVRLRPAAAEGPQDDFR